MVVGTLKIKQDFPKMAEIDRSGNPEPYFSKEFSPQDVNSNPKWQNLRKFRGYYEFLVPKCVPLLIKVGI